MKSILLSSVAGLSTVAALALAYLYSVSSSQISERMLFKLDANYVFLGDDELRELNNQIKERNDLIHKQQGDITQLRDVQKQLENQIKILQDSTQREKQQLEQQVKKLQSSTVSAQEHDALQTQKQYLQQEVAKLKYERDELKTLNDQFKASQSFVHITTNTQMPMLINTSMIDTTETQYDEVEPEVSLMESDVVEPKKISPADSQYFDKKQV